MNEPTPHDSSLPNDPLATHLSRLSESTDTRPASLWREALARSRPASTRRPGPPIASWRNAPFAKPLAAAALLLIVASVALVPLLGRVNRPLPAVSASELRTELDESAKKSTLDSDGSFSPSAATTSFGSASRADDLLKTQPDAKVEFSRASSPQPPPSPDPGSRHVIRKVTIQLSTSDVPAAFAKASLLVSEPLGEFIERSSLSGAPPARSAELLLRVSASRLDAVLTQLRQLGVVTSENAAGEDVTARVVDLDARLRNERRIESELLTLLDSRPDSPLEEVLALRAELSRVRLGIEQLDGQKQHLSRAVSLATVLVIIRSDQLLPDPTPPGFSLGQYFSQRMSRAWSSGVKGLVNSVSAILEGLLAGLVWWIALLFAALLVFAAFKRAYHAAANEPAPRL